MKIKSLLMNLLITIIIIKNFKKYNALKKLVLIAN